MKTFNDEWDDFVRDILPKDISEAQSHDMKVAFMAGCYSCLHLLADMPNHVTQEQGVIELNILSLEAKEFFRQNQIEAHE